MRDRIIEAFNGAGLAAAEGARYWHEVLGQDPSPQRALRPAAVLVPLVDRRDGMTVLLTLRTDHLKSHAGQVSFPGGRREESDATPEITALREAEEEIGLRREAVSLIGRLEVRETGTGFRVVPVVGLIEPPLGLEPDPSEVAEVFEVPLDHVLDPSNHRLEKRLVRGEEREFHVVDFEDYYIWGLTARLLVVLSKVVGR